MLCIQRTNEYIRDISWQNVLWVITIQGASENNPMSHLSPFFFFSIKCVWGIAEFEATEETEA